MKSKLRNTLQENKFVFTAETSPPDSGNKDVIINKVECLKNLADAINVTDGAGANSHMSIRCLELGVPAIIGVGEIRYKKLAKAKIININSQERNYKIIN